MEAFFTYLLKSVGILSIFFLTYKVFLQKETFFSINRHYLLGGLLASLLLPFLVFKSYIYIDPTPVSDIAFDTSTILPSQAVIETKEPFNWMQLFFSIYIIGVIMVGIRFFAQLWSLIRLIKSGTIQYYKNLKLIVVSEDISPFSFFNIIVCNPKSFSEGELEIILNHEKAHGKQLHTIDVLVSQLFLIFQWCNPLAWYYKKDIQHNLEFLADKVAAENTASKTHYQHTLLKTSIPNFCTSITNNFYNSLIKKRIVMLNQSSSKKRNLLKYSLILPAIALFLFSFNTKEVVIVKEAIKTEFLIQPSSTKSDLNAIEDYFKNNKAVMLKFNDLKRNSSNELTHLSINTKYRSNKKFFKRLSIKTTEGEEKITAFKLNYNNIEQSFILTKLNTGLPESKILENTIKILSPVSISTMQSKQDNTLGDNPLYIINGKKIKSDKLQGKKTSLDGKIIQLNKKEGQKQYGDDGKDGVLIFDGKTSINTTSEIGNEIIATITKNTTKEELDQIEKDLTVNGMEFNYSNLDFNSANEITSIKIKYRNKSKGDSGVYYSKGDDNDPIKPIYIFTKENGGFGIGNSPDDNEHEKRMSNHDERMKVHEARMEEHKARQQERKERMYVHKKRMEDRNKVMKKEHEERMEEQRARMEERQARIEEEHEERLEKHEERIEVHKAKMKELQGRVSIHTNHDDHDTKIKFRSENGKTPLFIVDGVEKSEAYVKNLSKDEIVTINVNKGTSSGEYGDKGKDGVIVIVTKEGAYNFQVDRDSNSSNKLFLIDKSTSDTSLNSYKQELKKQGIDLKVTGVKRNKDGEITRIKISLDDNNGSKSSSAYNNNPGTIPTIIVGKKGDNLTISKSN